jgi:hypothetical protein
MELEQREEETRLRKHTIMWSSLSIQLQSELAKRLKSQENEKELKKRAEKINLEIGLLITRKVPQIFPTLISDRPPTNL